MSPKTIIPNTQWEFLPKFMLYVYFVLFSQMMEQMTTFKVKLQFQIQTEIIDWSWIFRDEPFSINLVCGAERNGRNYHQKVAFKFFSPFEFLKEVNVSHFKCGKSETLSWFWNIIPTFPTNPDNVKKFRFNFSNLTTQGRCKCLYSMH